MFPSGFISTSDDADYTTKYIAPLPLALDCHHDPSSSLSYWFADKNQSVTLQWENAVLKDIPLKAPFTFRAKLWKSGLIEFMYKEIGINLEYIESWIPKIKTGISDSITSYKMTYRYHLVEIPIKYIQINSIISIRPISGKCIDMKSCMDCAAVFNSVTHDCYWCPDIQKCLSGMDFHKPQYSNARCSSAESKNVCLPPTTTTVPPSIDLVETEDIQLDTKSEYYNATVIRSQEKAKNLWVDMSKNSYNAFIFGKPHPLYGQYRSIQLSFPFNFFGDTKTTLLLRRYPGEIILINAWETKTYSDRIKIWTGTQEYFLTEKVLVEYKTTFNSLTLQWTIGSDVDVKICYQLTLHSRGNIDFVYKTVKEYGLNFLGLFRSTLDELNVNVAHTEDYLGNWTAIRFQAEPTCADHNSCNDCVTTTGCRWCPLANKCTDKHTRDDDWTIR